MAHKFRGTGVALVTPFDNTGAVDYQALEEVVNHVINGGVDYLVALGTTSEAPTMSPQEKAAVLAHIIKVNNKRVPVVCGIGGNNTAEVIHQLHTYNLDGVDGILSVAPYYNKPTQEGIYQHFKAIAQATELPIILYNVPGRTVVNMLPSTTLRLANEFKNIVAIKEASGNLPQCMKLVHGKPEHFAILSGDDDLIVSQVAIGMEGVISVAANCYPKPFTQMVKFALDGHYKEAQHQLYKLLTGIDLLFAEGNPAGVKCVLAQMGLGSNTLRLPIVPVSDDTAKRIEEFLKTI